MLTNQKYCFIVKKNRKAVFWKEENRLKGSDIKKYLIENGIKQSYLSEKTGIPSPILNMILNDNRKIEANEYMRICDALGVPLEQFKPDKAKKLLVR